MIPKIIHYCWFGCNPLPESALKCIDSWRQFFPDYEIKQWNESNFDVEGIPYTKEAYGAKKYAFVSDYARFKILYENGGLYFDTDVEVIKSFEDILSKGGFMGCESSNELEITINPGVGLGIEKGHPLYKEILNKYSKLHFLNPDGSNNQTTIVTYTTELLKQHGLIPSKEIQRIEEISIYPQDYFNPLDDNTGKLDKTENTHSIHWFAKTWIDANPLRIKMSRLAHRVFGVKFTGSLRKLLRIK